MTALKILATIIATSAATVAITLAPLSGLQDSTPQDKAARSASPLADFEQRAAALRRQIDQQNQLAAEMLEHNRQYVADLERIAPLVPVQYRELVINSARANDLDPLLIAQVGWTESRWNPNAIGTSGEIGIMQIMPDTAKLIAASMHYDGAYDLTDPATNLAFGAAYLRMLVNDHGSIDEALAAYNGGPQWRERAPTAARSYVDRVRHAGQNGG